MYNTAAIEAFRFMGEKYKDKAKESYTICMVDIDAKIKQLENDKLALIKQRKAIRESYFSAVLKHEKF